MARRFRDKVLEGSGYSNKKFECDFGLKLLQKMGWKGEGLGRDQQGGTECIQIKRRDEGLGLGVQDQKKNEFQWNDTWWETHYNEAVKSIAVIKNEHSSNATSDESSSGEDKKTKKKKKAMKKVTVKKTKLKAKKEVKSFEHLFSSCSSSSEEETVYKKSVPVKKTKKIRKVSEDHVEIEKNKKKSKEVKKAKKVVYSAESDSDDQ